MEVVAKTRSVRRAIDPFADESGQRSSPRTFVATSEPDD